MKVSLIQLLKKKWVIPNCWPKIYFDNCMWERHYSIGCNATVHLSFKLTKLRCLTHTYHSIHDTIDCNYINKKSIRCISHKLWHCIRKMYFWFVALILYVQFRLSCHLILNVCINAQNGIVNKHAYSEQFMPIHQRLLLASGVCGCVSCRYRHFRVNFAKLI